MKSITTSIKVFGIYMVLIPGIGLIAFPELILDLFNISHGGILWAPRMIGLLAFIIGTFDLYIAKYEIHQMYRLTVMLRYFAAAFMVVLWLTGQVEVMILLFAAIDALGASWTLLAIKSTGATIE